MSKKPQYRARLEDIDRCGEWWVVERRGWFGWSYVTSCYGRDRAIEKLKGAMRLTCVDRQIVYDYEVASFDAALNE